MENQHRKIAGYRELSQAEIDLMNKVKAQGLTLQALIKEVQAHTRTQHVAALDGSPEFSMQEQERLRLAEPERWAALGRTHFQEGLMALTRAVAQPTFF